MIPSLLLVVLPLVAAAPWAQPADSEVYKLFPKRQNPTYPPALKVPDVSTIPQAWLDKLKSVESQIAKVPISTPVQSKDSNAVTYPNGTNIEGPDVCAFPTGCTTKDDIHDAPPSTFLITFDDGPGDGSKMLADFLESKNMSTHATHFMIGASIVAEPALFKYVFERGGHIASHTWSHARQTILTNEQIVGELGWTMQAIADNTGGRLPLFWRPPYGDIDNRVRDVAKKVFGLETVLWNRDTNDWKIAAEGKAPVEKIFDEWAYGAQNVGLNVLMHEINPKTVEIFIEKFQNFINLGWKVMNVAEAYNKPMYFNAADNKAEVKSMVINDLGATGAVSAGASATGSAAAGASGAGSKTSGAASPNGTAAADSKPSSAMGLLAPLATVLLATVFSSLF